MDYGAQDVDFSNMVVADKDEDVISLLDEKSASGLKIDPKKIGRVPYAASVEEDDDVYDESY